MDTNAEDVAKWLGRETGHVPEADEGYDEDEKAEHEPGRIGLPNAHNDRMRKFFDGLHLEKALTEKRRQKSVESLGEAEKMDEALRGSLGAGY